MQAGGDDGSDGADSDVALEPEILSACPDYSMAADSEEPCGTTMGFACATGDSANPSVVETLNDAYRDWALRFQALLWPLVMQFILSLFQIQFPDSLTNS